MDYIHWLDLTVLLICSAALPGVLALADLIGGRK